MWIYFLFWANALGLIHYCRIREKQAMADFIGMGPDMEVTRPGGGLVGVKLDTRNALLRPREIIFL
jgi:hypothetical protein